MHVRTMRMRIFIFRCMVRKTDPEDAMDGGMGMMIGFVLETVDRSPDAVEGHTDSFCSRAHMVPGPSRITRLLAARAYRSLWRAKVQWKRESDVMDVPG